jgi:hypothetical protein
MYLALVNCHPDRVRVVKGEQDIPHSAFARPGINGGFHIHGGALEGLLTGGASIYVRALEGVFPDVSRLCEAVEDALAVPASACACVQWPSVETSASPEWRELDLLWLQIDGKTRWRVHEPTTWFATEMVPSHVRPGSDGWKERELLPGHSVYVPRAWWFERLSVDTPSLGLLVSFRNPTGLDIVGRIFDRLSLVDFMRMDCPRFAEPEIQSRYLTRVQRECMDAISQPGILRDYLYDIRAMFGARPGLDLARRTRDPSDLTNDVVLKSVVRFSESIVDQVESNNAEVFFDGARLSVNDSSAAILREIILHGEIAMKDLKLRLSDRVSAESLTADVAALIDGGLIMAASLGQASSDGNEPAASGLVAILTKEV